ncbi:PilZ domain-containing protein [Pelomonas sp. Root1444]|uniref:PilZ domain-containing protein n=1 Tax=Pelomonas sp. Root1444 TaxID=1736464 RepID=UPI0007028085|nr:PilZ domain-containing protein [Pelomonas sp. Root1444]KQY88268.1 hypothetical protein ASD35_11805 [Pelomonas sp. Root1444]
MSTEKDDRRSGSRQVLRTKAQLLFQEGLLLEARTLNLSISGMAIVADGPVAPGTTFALRCFLPVAGSKVELVTQARVVHSIFSNAEGGFAIGIVFVKPSVEVLSLISRALGASR